MKFQRAYPNIIEQQKSAKTKEDVLREDTILIEKRRKEGFFYSYTREKSDPKEAQRVRSL